MSLDDRSVRILEALIEYDFLNVKQISDILSISRRSIYYSFENINYWLDSNNLPLLQNRRGQGYYLQDKSLYIEALSSVNIDTYLNQEERQSLISCLILVSENKVIVETIMDMVDVSRNSVFTDLKIIKDLFDEYDLELIFDRQKGYIVEGSELKKRAVFLKEFYVIQQLVLDANIKNSIKYSFLNRTKIMYIYAKLKKIEQVLNTEYVEHSLISLAALINIVFHSNTAIEDRSFAKEKLESTLEFQLLEQEFPEMSLTNLRYFTIHLLSTRTQLIVSRNVMRENFELAKEMIEYFESLAAVMFENKSLLIKQISNHLSSSYYRYKFGIHHVNPLLSQIKDKYPHEFYLTNRACDILRNRLNTPVNEDEVAYITLYFASFLYRKSFSRDQITFHVVCPSGVSTSLLLKTELEYLDPKIQVENLMSISTFKKTPIPEGDIIISTVNLDTDKEYIRVNPVLSVNDKQRILSHIPTEEISEFKPEINDIIKIIKPYVQEHDMDALEEKLNRYFVHEYKLKVNKEVRLLDIFKIENIAVVEDVKSWEEGLYLAASPLLKQNLIEERYIDAIISSLNHYGAYMVIEGGYMFAHASYEDGVHGLGLSLLKIENPVIIRNEKVDKIFVLSTPDQKQHLGVVKDLYHIFTNVSFNKAIVNCLNPLKLYEEISKLLLTE